MKSNHSGTIARFLRAHPRLLGALFALAVLVTQATPVLAECSGSTCSGP